MNKNLFNSIKLTKPTTNRFDLTHDHKLSCNMGDLVPVMVLEAVPGDKFNISHESLMRLAPMVAPMMHRCDVTFHTFFVPNRIVWPNWETYITNQKLPATGLPPEFPTIQVSDLNFTKLHNYMGIPKWTDVTPVQGKAISAIPFAAYQLIYNEYYRDQNLIEEVSVPLVDGDNNFSRLWTLRKRAWEHDYFTAALPWAQKGDPVMIPISGIVEINPDRDVTQNITVVEQGDGTTPLPLAGLETGAGAAHLLADGNDAMFDFNGNYSVENANSTINDLRRAYRLQEWLEKAARGGSRYIENILIHFGVRSSDKRLQRPEYITGTKSPIQISEVLNTTGTADAPQGSMAGHGIGVTSGKSGSYYCEEHGYIISIMSVLPKTAYFQGCPKHYLKINNPMEFYWPTFANIGEQEVTGDELYFYQDPATYGSKTFGYVPRYAEYKYQPSRVSGDFTDTLDFWHMARRFPAPPELNSDFVSADPTFRVFAVEDPEVDHLWIHVLNKVSAVRKMPYFGTPTF